MSSMPEIPLHFDDVGHAWALAQLVKRITSAEIEQLSANSTEADAMREAVDQVGRDLAAAGFAPR